MAQPRAHQILMRGDAEYPREQPQKVKRRDAALAGGLLEADFVLGMRIDPERGLDGAAAVARCSGLRFWCASGHHRDKAAGKHLSDLVEPEVGPAIGGSLGQFTEHHQLRQWREAADLPDFRSIAEHLDQFVREEKRQALVTADVVMAAGKFITGVTDKDSSRDQFEETAAAATAEAALAYIGDRMTAVLLDER